MKELPYFRFYPAEWKSGKISAFGAIEQGVYLNLCILAWAKGGEFEIEEELLAKQMEISVEKLTEIINSFIKYKLLHFDANAMQKFYMIKFVEQQFQSSKHLSKIRAKSAEKRWQIQPQNNAIALQTDAKTDDKDKDKDKDKDIKEILKKNISFLYHRKDSTSWTDKENSKLVEIAKRADAIQEFEEIKKLYESGYKYRRQDIITLLNNWTGELDRARNNKSETGLLKEEDFKPL